MRLADRIVDLLYCLQSDGSGIGVTEIALKVGLPKSTTHRLLQALERRSLVVQDDRTQRYTLGLGLLAMASTVLQQRNLFLLPAHKDMERLRDLSGETVCLHVPLGLERVCISQVESPHAIRYTMEIGKPMPLYGGATGKLLLAYMPDRVVDQVVQMTGLAPLTPNTITDPLQLREELRTVRTQGYAVSFEETAPLVAAAAAPVRDGRGQVIASVTLYGPRMRLTEERMPGLLPELLATARSISDSMCRPLGAG